MRRVEEEISSLLNQMVQLAYNRAAIMTGGKQLEYTLNSERTVLILGEVLTPHNADVAHVNVHMMRY